MKRNEEIEIEQFEINSFPVKFDEKVTPFQGIHVNPIEQTGEDSYAVRVDNHKMNPQTMLMGDRIELVQRVNNPSSDMYKILDRMNGEEARMVRNFIDASSLNILNDILYTEVSTIVWNSWSMLCQYVDLYTNPKTPEQSLIAKYKLSIGFEVLSGLVGMVSNTIGDLTSPSVDIMFKECALNDYASGLYRHFYDNTQRYIFNGYAIDYDNEEQDPSVIFESCREALEYVYGTMYKLLTVVVASIPYRMRAMFLGMDITGKIQNK